MTGIKAFLIEPLAGTIRPVTIDRENSYLDIKTHLNCDMIDIVRLEGGHDIIVDDNGLDESLPCITEVTGGQTPLAGNLLFTKSDEYGELVDVTEAIETVASLFIIIRPVLHPVIVVSERPGVIATHLTRIEIGLDRNAPRVVEAAEA